MSTAVFWRLTILYITWSLIFGVAILVMQFFPLTQILDISLIPSVSISLLMVLCFYFFGFAVIGLIVAATDYLRIASVAEKNNFHHEEIVALYIDAGVGLKRLEKSSRGELIIMYLQNYEKVINSIKKPHLGT